MLKNLIILPDGTELFSGKGTTNAIMSATLTDCVNSREELTLGSTCANMLEATIWTPGGGLSLPAGAELTLYKVDDAGVRHKAGIFATEKPTRPSTNTMKITGYDRVTKLDKDLSGWLKSLTGWPYTLLTFAQMVCEACGLVLATESIPNESFSVKQFSKPEVTGRQLMQWIGEVCCRFCRANADGEIEFAWYTPSGVSIAPSGVNRYYAGGLSYEDYQVARVEAVQLRLADSEYGYLWPEVPEGANAYIITDNPLFTAAVTEDTLAHLKVIENELAGLTYTPCKVSFPARLDVRAGNTVEVTDINGITFTACVMTKKQKGQRDTISCTGSARRDSATAQNNKPGNFLEEEQEIQPTQEEIFQILTNGGEIEGLFMKDGQLYINASYIVAGKLSSKDGNAFFDLDNEVIQTTTDLGMFDEGSGAFIPTQKFSLQMAGGGLKGVLKDLATGEEKIVFRIRQYDDYIVISDGAGLNDPGASIAIHSNHSLHLGMNTVYTGIHGGPLVFSSEDMRWNGLRCSWMENGDGTCTMIGTPVAE